LKIFGKKQVLVSTRNQIMIRKIVPQIQGGSSSMLTFPIDCFLGEVFSVHKIGQNHFEVSFLISNSFGDNSIYSANCGENLTLAKAIFKTIDIHCFYFVMEKLYNYYQNEFNFQDEIDIVNSCKEDVTVVNFKNVKLIHDGISIETDGEIANKINQIYGDIKFAGFVFMNESFYKCIDDKNFNKINLSQETRNIIGSENTFNLLVPVGNLKKCLKLTKKAVNISLQ
jgi:hypothetical protein